MPSPQEFAASIKAKYPQYAEIPDDELVTRILDKHPVYRERITQPPPQAAPEAPPQSMGLGEMASSAVGNLPGSAWQLAKDVTAPIHSLVETATALGGLAAGGSQRVARSTRKMLGVESEEPGAQEGNVDALISFVSERYGGLENIKRTVAEDPAGFLADIAGLAMGGGGAVAKAAGTAGKLGSVAKKVSQAGRAIDPARLASAGAKRAGRAASTAVSEVLGLMGGTSAAPIKVGFGAGRKAGLKGGGAFLENIKGKIPMDEVVEQARTAVGKMHHDKMEAYRTGLGSAFKDTAQKPIDFGKVAETADKAMTQGKFKGVDISESTSAVRTKIQDRLEQWKALDPAEFHTVEGMDALRKSIGDVVDSAPFSTPERRLAEQVYFAVRKSVEAQAPGYGKVLKNYHEASKHLKDLEQALSLGKSAATETALRKLQAVMRNDVTSAYGKRAEYAKELAGAGAGNLEEALAGQAMQPWMPRAFASRVGSLGTGAATASGMISPYALPLVAAASPRIVGTAAYRAGQASSPLAAIMAQFNKLPPGTGQASFQAGRAARESRR